MGVASDLGEEFAALAVELIDSDQHELAKIKAPATTTGDQADPTTVPSSPTAVRVFEDKYSSYFERKLAKGASRLLYMSTESGVTPAQGDVIKLDRESVWQLVILVDRYGAGGTDALYVLHCGVK